MKHVLSIQDLSCTGRCSLTVALPVLSAMGCRCTVLPTTVLSSHTGFPEPHRRGLTEHIAPIARHWESLQMEFDAIGVGYLADPQQAEAVAQVLDTFPTLTVVDPAMGDHGKLYRSMTPEQVQAMARRGTVWVPTLSTIGNLRGKGRFDETAVCQILESALQNVAVFASMGGLIAPGTDAGAWAVPHGCLSEYELLTQALGTDTQAILDRGIRALVEKF